MSCLIDIGANLANPRLLKRLPELIAGAKSRRVGRIICTGTTHDSSLLAISLAQQHAGFIFATSGIHPHYAGAVSDEELEQTLSLSRFAEVVAIGECGLDYHRMLAPRSRQREVFESHVRLAKQAEKPLFLHCRGVADCYKDFHDILKEYGFPPGVVHCFTGSPEQATLFVESGYYIGVTGWVCDRKRGCDLIDALGVIPPERLLLETDAPYLHPLLKQEDNTPENLFLVAQKVASIVGFDVESLITLVEKSTTTLFRMSPCEPAGTPRQNPLVAAP